MVCLRDLLVLFVVLIATMFWEIHWLTNMIVFTQMFKLLSAISYMCLHDGHDVDLARNIALVMLLITRHRHSII